MILYPGNPTIIDQRKYFMEVNRRILTDGHLGGDGPYAKAAKNEKCTFGG